MRQSCSGCANRFVGWDANDLGDVAIGEAFDHGLRAGRCGAHDRRVKERTPVRELDSSVDVVFRERNLMVLTKVTNLTYEVILVFVVGFVVWMTARALAALVGCECASCNMCWRVIGYVAVLVLGFCGT